MKKSHTSLPGDTLERRHLEFIQRSTQNEVRAMELLMEEGWKIQVKRLISSQRPPEEWDLVATLISPDTSS